MTNPDLTAIDRFRMLLWSDTALQDRLSSFDRPDSFADAAIEAAAAHDIPIVASELSGATRPDPLGISNLNGAPPNARGVPPSQWLPIGIVPTTHGPAINWSHFGGARLAESFYTDSLRRAGTRPLNRLLSVRTPLQDLVESPRLEDAVPPNGFIFHMSRCGSTLVSQMLAALPGTIVASEPPPVDQVVRMAGLTDEMLPWKIRALQAIVAATGRNRSGADRHFIVKTDAWHIHDLPLFRAAFPDVPWIFLYRDPVEVLVSQARMSGMMTVPGEISAATFGLADTDPIPGPDYNARVFGTICEAARRGYAAGGGLLINYSELPGAVYDRILGHFGIAANAEERAAMAAATQRDAKATYQEFRPDADAKQKEASPAIRAAVEEHLAGVYAQLEALRTG